MMNNGPAARQLAQRYDLIERIGEGASAITWGARDTRLGRIVAVKLLRRALAEEPDYAQRFEREAQLAASISHPNVVDVFDVGQDDGQLYIVMQYIEGEDLKHRIEREGRIAPDGAVAIAQQILDGLGAIHRAGIVHRDIKPQNVLIGKDGMARVTDFGVAHIDAGEGLTSTGMAIGTVAYMAPEQAEGGAVNEVTDIYAAGVVLYEMLTGHLPFHGATPLAIMMAHLQQPVTPPSQAARGAGISPALDGVVLQAMAKAPADRFRSARAMSQALTGALRGGSAERATARLAGKESTYPNRPPPPPVSRPAPPTGGSPAAAVAPGPPKRPRSTLRMLLSWLMVLATLGSLGYMVARGLPGHGDAGNQTLPAIFAGTTTPPTATAPATKIPSPTQPAPTETRAVILPLDPTSTPVPTDAPTPTETPVPTEPPTQPPIGPVDGQQPGENLILPSGGATDAAGSVQGAAAHEVRADLAPADWRDVPLTTLGGDEVALLSGAGSGSDAATLRVRLSGMATGEGLTLSLRGAGVSPDGASVPLSLRVNGTIIVARETALPASAPGQASFGEAVFDIPAANLVDGENTLEIANDAAGSAGEPPYVALSTGTLAMRVTGADGAIEIEPPPASQADGSKIKPTKRPKPKNGNGNGQENGNANGKDKDGNGG